MHRPIAGHGQVVRADEGIEVRAAGVVEMVFGEKLAVDFDAKKAGLFGDMDAVLCGGGNRERASDKHQREQRRKRMGAERRKIHSGRGAGLRIEDLIAAKPAGALGGIGNLHPGSLVVEDGEFGAVADFVVGGGFLERAVADLGFTGDDDDAGSEIIKVEGDGKTHGEQKHDHGDGDGIRTQGGFEVGPPLGESERQEQEPERDHQESCPFVEREFIEKSADAVGLVGHAAAGAGAGEVEVGAEVGVTRRESFCLEIRSDGAAELVRLEKGVAAVEIKGGGGIPGGKEFVVGVGGIGKLALLVKSVGGVEAGGEVIGAKVRARKRGEQEEREQ